MVPVTRVGNCSGFYGDRLSAMREMLDGGELDYLTGDYLAELTMLILGRDQLKDSQLGYAKTFVNQLTGSLAVAKERGVRIVSNAGGLNPAGLADQVQKIAAEQDLDINVAFVTGDNLIADAQSLGFGDALTANAYLGAFGIARALTAGADVVITGRVTDASLTVGPAIAEFGWQRDDYDQLAGAVIAGHVLECGAQATGGNFAGFLQLAEEKRIEPLGFPIAEISPDGSSVITKHANTGGAVTVDTVTAQLVYEIGAPVYLNPDVSARLDSVSVRQQAPDRVQLSGVRGSAPPPETKICLNYLGGYRNTVEFVLTGLDIDAKASWVQQQFEASLADELPDRLEWKLDHTTLPDPTSQATASSVLRCSAFSKNQEPVGRSFSNAAVQLALASIPGFTMTSPPAPGTPYGVYRAAYLPQNDVPHQVVLPSGEIEDIEPPEVVDQVESWPTEPRVQHNWTDEPAELNPLGSIAYSRSGDKGGDANVGVWIRSDHPDRELAHDWLVSLLTEEYVANLLPEAAQLPIQVYELPNLAAVNIVITGLLGEGVASSTRPDPQAKALGEWLRARWVKLPDRLIEAAS